MQKNRFAYFLLAIPLLWAPLATLAEDVLIAPVLIEDHKAVLATVEPIHQFIARARIGGTLTILSIREGDTVRAGDEVGLVVDQKLALQLKALDERIRSQEAQKNQAQIDFDRISELIRRGAGTQAQLDLFKTALEVQERGLNALRNDKAVLAGESIATLAEEHYILRVQLPERHARFLRAGDHVLINDRNGADQNMRVKQQGEVKIVYPEIVGGRVIADIQVPDLGSYFVGERTLVYLGTGQREALYVPHQAISVHAGLHYVTLSNGVQVVVQTGEQVDGQTEILTGLRAGDSVKVKRP